MFQRVLFLIVLTIVLVSCNSSSSRFSDKTIESLASSLRMCGKEITPSHLRYYAPRGLSSDEEREIERGFRQFFKMYKEVRPEYRDIPAVKTFLARYINLKPDYNAKAARGTFTGESPLAVAAALVFATTIDLKRIDEEENLRKGSELLSISEEELAHGIYFILERTQDQIFATYHNTLLRESRRNRTMTPETFMRDIFLPLGTLFSAGVGITDKYLEEFSQLFSSVFESDGELLSDFVNEFLGYLHGETMHMKVQKDLNAVFVQHGFYFDIERNYCGVFRIEKSLEVNHKALRAVNLLKEFELCRLKTSFGDAMYKESVVNVYQNSVENEVSKILGVLNERYLDSTLIEKIGMWQLEESYEADSFYRMIYEKDFGGKDSVGIRSGLIHEVAIHEAKHAWDAQFDTTSRKRRAFDSEVSAHLTEAALSSTPHYSLMMCLNRFYSYLGYYELRQPILKLNEEVWRLMERSISGEISDSDLRESIGEIYSDYRDKDSLPFPKMNDFTEAIGTTLTSL